MNPVARISWALRSAGALAGAALGGALGYVDIICLKYIIDFAQPKNFSSLPGEFVGYLLIGMNSGGGFAIGLTMISVLPRRNSRPVRVLAAIVLGGYLGALLGFLDMLVVAHYLNLLDSDLVATWRENRSLLVILNSGAIALVGAGASLR